MLTINEQIALREKVIDIVAYGLGLKRNIRYQDIMDSMSTSFGKINSIKEEFASIKFRQAIIEKKLNVIKTLLNKKKELVFVR